MLPSNIIKTLNHVVRKDVVSPISCIQKILRAGHQLQLRVVFSFEGRQRAEGQAGQALLVWRDLLMALVDPNSPLAVVNPNKDELNQEQDVAGQEDEGGSVE